MAPTTITYPKFAVGKVVLTAAVAAEKRLTPTIIQALLWRHRTGDFGTISTDPDPNDRTMNDRAIKVGRGRVMSAYEVEGLTLWFITELSDLSGQTYTTVLFPEDN